MKRLIALLFVGLMLCGATAPPAIFGANGQLQNQPATTGLNVRGGGVTTPECPPAVNELGYLGAPQPSGGPYTGNHTLGCTTGSDSDFGKLVVMNCASACTLTIPTNATIAAPIGTIIPVFSKGAGATTVSPAAGVNLYQPGGTYSAAVTYGQNSLATLIQTSANNWTLTGLGTGPSPSTGTAPPIRGTPTGVQSTAASFNINLPTGTVAGDFGVMICEGGNTINTPAGWSIAVTQGFGYWSQLVFTEASITSTEITAGHIALTTVAFSSICHLATFANGAQIWNVGWLATQNDTGGVASNINLMSPGGPLKSNAYYLIACTIRGNSTQLLSGQNGGSPALLGSNLTSTNGSGSLWGWAQPTVSPWIQCNNNAQAPTEDIMLGIVVP